MVIDFHVHLAQYENLSQSTFEFGAAAHPSKEAYIAYCRQYSDPANFAALMDANGVDYTVVLAEYAPLTTGIATNEKVAEFCRDNPRLIPFCSLNPYAHTDMHQRLEDLVTNQGFRGLKLYPTYNHFYPNDNFMYHLYAAAQRLGIPVLFHTGSSVFTNSRIKYGNPILFDDVAVDFPDLKIVMAHGGRGPWYEEAMTMVRLHRNVFIDVTGLPPQKLTEFFPDMRRFADKFIFGSDWPAADVRKNVEAICSLDLPADAVTKVLWQNAAGLLGIQPR